MVEFGNSYRFFRWFAISDPVPDLENGPDTGMTGIYLTTTRFFVHILAFLRAHLAKLTIQNEFFAFFLSESVSRSRTGKVSKACPFFSNVKEKVIFKGNILFYFRERILSSQHAVPHDHTGGTAQSHSSFLTLL
jgi:hypothetical protein